MISNSLIAAIPMQMIGPIKIKGSELNDEVNVPLATFETPLWPSTARGAKISRLCEGIEALIVSENMTRSVVLETINAQQAFDIISTLKLNLEPLKEVVQSTGRFVKLQECHFELVGNLIYIRFSMITGDASGHNMATKAAEAAIQYLLKTYPSLKYVSISANLCVDKKVSAINGILGRGKYVVADIVVPYDICVKHLRTTPEKIKDLHIKKNLLGSILAGSLRSANAHFANMLLAVYLATGQDAANIIEGSQGIVHVDVNSDNNLYFSVTIPNLIVGSIGNGKDLEFVKNNLRNLGCLEERAAGLNARRLSLIIAATVLCGELSLLSAQTNPGELVDSHLRLERMNQTKPKVGKA
ncbi:MAG: hmgA [Francisellaceae bacterium]|nr:hmgA [Francisellaceae bacterium]